MNILLLEDYTTDADLAYRYLKQNLESCNIDICESISKARGLLNKGYDVALLDINLPDGYGTELLFDLLESNDQMVIVMLTGSGDEEIAVTALKSGADDYLVKEGRYLERLPDIINYHLKQKEKKEKLKKTVINVLYLEHQKADIELTLLHFKRYAFNFRIKAVSNSKHMFDLLPESDSQKNDFQVVLMDYNLPGLSAIEITKEIRQNRNLDIPIVIVTGQGSEEIAIQALKLGVDEYIVKRDNYLNRLPSLLVSAYQKHVLETQNKQLIESEQKFRHSFDYANVGKAIVDLDGKLIRVNNKLCKIMGAPKDEIENQSVFSFIHQLDIESLRKLYTISGKIHIQNDEIEMRLINNLGKVIWAMVSISLVRDFENHPLYYILHIQDITLRKEAIEKNRQLSLSVEQSPAMVIITDLNGDIKYVNPKFSEVTGYSIDEVLNKNPRLLKSGHKKHAEYKELWETITRGEVWDGEFLNRKKDGGHYWESSSISPLKDEQGNVTHFIAIKLDITEQKKNESRIRRLNEELEERVEERTKELFDANVKLEKAIKTAESASKAKSEFLANMSHEIRTPMNAVLGFADILDRQISDVVHKDYLKSIKSSGKTLLSIINDILDLSKIESGNIGLNPEPVALSVIVRELKNMFKYLAAEKGLDFSVEFDSQIPDFLLVDELRIKQVLINLLSNAIKFTHDGSVKFSIKISSKTDSTIDLYICVEDTGIGISKKGLTKILEPFEQEEGQDDKIYGGTGLGLAISNKIILLHGSKLKIKSKLGVGSSFSFKLSKITIYQDELEKPKESVINPERIMFHGQKVLIVDDDSENRKLLQTYLGNLNLHLIEVENGQLAIDEINQNIPDIVLMDMRMPKLNGYDAAKTIRKKHPLGDLPIVLMTASVFYNKKQIMKPFNDYLTKPIQIEQLLLIMSRYLKCSIDVEDINDNLQKELEILDVLTQQQLLYTFRVRFAELLGMIRKKFSNEHIKQLARELELFGNEIEVPAVNKVSSDLKHAIASYNIEGILKILQTLYKCL